MEHLNWIDYIIIGIVGLSTLISLLRGFIREALSLASWIIAFWVGLTFASKIEPILIPYIHDSSIRFGIAFFILFVGVLLLGALINYIITRLLEKTGLSGTDRLIGLVFGFTRGILLVAVFLLAARFTSLPQDTVWKSSQLIPKMTGIETWLAQYIPKNILINKNITDKLNPIPKDFNLKDQKKDNDNTQLKNNISNSLTKQGVS